MTLRRIIPKANNQVETMKKYTIFTTIALGLALSAPAWALNGDIEAGKQKVIQVCAACHGADGNSTAPTFPRLAGQYPDYLIITLKRYKTKERVDPIMNAQAANLSDQDIANVAAYFYSQEGLHVKH